MASPSQQIAAVFAACKAEGRPAFVPYLTAGFPSKAQTVPLLLAMEQAGADILELGVPFSDPMADGPTIQYSNTVALEQGVTYADCLQMVREAREQGLKAPVVLMGYINPLIKYGEERAVVDAKAAGANAFIVVDLPLEEEPLFFKACRTHGMSFVPLMAPTSLDGRLTMLARAADSFVYCVSVLGVTGQRSQMAADLPEFLARVRAHCNLPLAVGFGISTREHFVHVAGMADAVVIGSAVIKTVRDAEKGKEAEAVAAYIRGVTGRA